MWIITCSCALYVSYASILLQAMSYQQLQLFASLNTAFTSAKAPNGTSTMIEGRSLELNKNWCIHSAYVHIHTRTLHCIHICYTGGLTMQLYTQQVLCRSTVIKVASDLHYLSLSACTWTGSHHGLVYTQYNTATMDWQFICLHARLVHADAEWGPM